MLDPPFQLVLPFSFSRKKTVFYQGWGGRGLETVRKETINNKLENTDVVVDYKVGICWEHLLCCMATQSLYGGSEKAPITQCIAWSIWLNCTDATDYSLKAFWPPRSTFLLFIFHRIHSDPKTQGKSCSWISVLAYVLKGKLFCSFPILSKVTICSALPGTNNFVIKMSLHPSFPMSSALADISFQNPLNVSAFSLLCSVVFLWTIKVEFGNGEDCHLWN